MNKNQQRFGANFALDTYQLNAKLMVISGIFGKLLDTNIQDNLSAEQAELFANLAQVIITYHEQVRNEMETA